MSKLFSHSVYLFTKFVKLIYKTITTFIKNRFLKSNTGYYNQLLTKYLDKL